MSIVWPFYPKPEVTEQHSWLTDVMNTPVVDGRVSVRPSRRTFTYRYAHNDPKFANITALYEEHYTDDWLLPIWSEGSRSSVLALDVIISCDTNANYTDQVMIYKGCHEYVIGDILSILPGQIMLTAPVGVDIENAFICPLSEAYCVLGIDASRSSSKGNHHWEISFQQRNYLAPEAITYPQYGELDLVSNCLAVAPLPATIAPKVVYVDNGAGPVHVHHLQDYLGRQFKMQVVCEEYSKWWNSQNWLNRIRGRDRPFWLASWSADMVLASPITAAGTSIVVEPVYSDVAKYVGRSILIDDGAKSPREITAASVTGESHRLFIAPLGRDISTARIGFLRKVRSAIDELTVEHTLGFTSRFELNVIEAVS